MKICTIIGARPQFVKAAVVSAKFAELAGELHGLEEIIVHTGQHYDPEMSEIFFKELKIPREKYNLESGSGSHGTQTGKMLEKIEKVLIDEKPDCVLIYGDTNSTLAGALAAAKLNILCAHVEAGMRSFNRKMPEEINRVVADHICNFNFCSTETAVQNLKNEGRGDTALLVGDVMYDCSLKFEKIAEKHYDIMGKFSLEKEKFILMTCHRQENTDCPERLANIVAAVNEASKKYAIVFPVHPRTKKFLETHGLKFSPAVRTVAPLSYFEMLILEKNARFILTDSGGVQKEAFFFRVPCVTMRDETEWVETVELGWNVITGADKDRILSAIANFAKNPPVENKSLPYGNGDASDKIVRQLYGLNIQKKF